jgi:RNA recognition motif-containing protein
VNKKIFVGNLDFDLETEDLKNIFSKFGNIEDCIVIKDRDSNQSKGFGFVTFVDGESADEAIREINGKEIKGRKLTVNVAEEKEKNHSKQRFKKLEPVEEDEYAKYVSTEF